MFEFALIENVKVPATGNGSQGLDPITIDRRDIDLCQSRLREVTPDVQKMIDRAGLLPDVAAIGPVQLVAMPKAR